MTGNEIRASARFYDRCCYICVIAFFLTVLIPHGLGFIANFAALAGMIGFAIGGARVARQLRQIALHNRGLPGHCLKCGERLHGQDSGRCPACMKVISPRDVQGDPTKRNSATPSR